VGENINFASQEKLRKHFIKHKEEFDNITESEYLYRAQQLVNSNPGEDILIKIRNNGDVLFFNEDTGEFAVKAKNGFIRTFFRPIKGIEYFLKQ